MPADTDLALGSRPAWTDPLARVFEDVAEGDELPPIRTPVLSTAHLVRWSAAIENWHRIHYDQRFAVEHDGLPDVAVPGSWKQQILFRLVKDWAGPAGWVAELSCQFRGLDTPGAVLTATGRVSRLFVHGAFGFVACATQLRTGEDGVSATGDALVVLRRRGGPSLPDPFPADLMPRV